MEIFRTKYTRKSIERKGKAKVTAKIDPAESSSLPEPGPQAAVLEILPDRILVRRSRRFFTAPISDALPGGLSRPPVLYF
jgi:hypothetical protein